MTNEPPEYNQEPLLPNALVGNTNPQPTEVVHPFILLERSLYLILLGKE